MEAILQPKTKLPPRVMILAVMLIPVFITPNLSWGARLLACFVPFMLTGTYRVSTVEGDKFRSQLFVGFFPMKIVKCNLASVHYIETKYNSFGAVIDTFPFLSIVQFIFIGIFDLLMPALGGAYEIWLITSKGREIVAWQGFHEKFFQDNLALLTARSGAELRARSR